MHTCSVTHSCPTLCHHVDYSPPGFLCAWSFSGKHTGVSCHFLLQGVFLTQVSNLGLLHCRWILLPLSHLGSPLITIGKFIFFSPALATFIKVKKKNALPWNKSQKVTQSDLKSHVRCVLWLTGIKIEIKGSLKILIYLVINIQVCIVSHFSHVQLSGTLWAFGCKASLSMGFSRQEYWR